MAHLRWAVIALEQGARHVSGREFSLELALTGRMVPELEQAILRATAPDAWAVERSFEMRDEPSGAALIEAARRALAEEVVPGLTGRPRYVALMVANALGIAAREIGEAGSLASAEAGLLAADDAESLVRAIREGRRDADPALHAALSVQADVASKIWKPRSSAKATEA